MTLTGRGGALAFALLLITSLLTPARAGAQTQATQSGTATIANGSASTTATITSVEMTRTFLVFSTTLDDANPANTQVRGELTNSTTLTFTRSGTTGAVTIKWSVVEYATGVTVQRGTTSSVTGTTNNITIASVNTSKSFPIISSSQSGTTFGSSHFLKAKLTSSTNLEVAVAAAGTPVVSWQVVEFTNASVQSGDVSFGTADSSKTDALTPSVNTAKSWLVYTHTSAAGTADNIGQKLVRGRITNATTLTFDRSNTGQSLNLTWYLIEFTDNTSVQAGSEDFTDTQTQQNVTLPTSVNTAKSFAVGGASMQEGRANYSGNDNPGVGWMTHELTSATNLRITRALDGNQTADMGWFVVTIPKAVIVTPVSGLTTTEAGGTATFTVSLDTAPTANVTIALSSSDLTEGTVSPTSLTFTTGNWSTPQTVTVTGVDDADDDGDQSYTIVTAAAVSSDATYSGVNAADVSVTTTDNDTGAETQARQATQSGTATIANGSASTTATISSVEMTRTFLVFSTTLDDDNPANTQVRGELTNSTTLKFTRSGTTGAVTIKWSVVEYATGVTVQRGTTSAVTGTTNNITIASVNTSKSFPIISSSQSGATFGGSHFLKAKLTSSTNLEVAVAAAGTPVVSWQVVEFTNASVQSGDEHFDTTDNSMTDPITSVNTAKSWLVYTHTSASGSSSNIGQKLVRGRITNSTTLTFDRSDTGQSMDLTWYLIEFTDNTSVQAGTAHFDDTETQQNVNLTSVNTAKSFAVGGASMQEGRSGYNNNDNPGVGWMTHELTSASNLRITRARTGSATADMGWFVVTIPKAVLVTPVSGLTTTEAGGTATFTVRLDTAPTASVTIPLSSSDLTEGTVSPASLTFTTGNWSTPQTVTVTGVDDADGDGDQSYTIVTAAATSSDASYDGVNGADVSVTTTDNDTQTQGGGTQATQSGTATMADGRTSTTATIRSVEMTRTFLVFSTTSDRTHPANAQVRGELTNSTTLTFTRSGTSGDVTIKWSVVEYATGVTVQRGTTSTLTGTTNNISIASVNTSKSFPIISSSQSGTTFGGSHFLKAKLTSATNLEVAVAAAGTPVVSWQVVEFTNASVQSGDVSFANNR